MSQIQDNQSGKQALRDYQMKLMLLEQQNKHRLLVARQQGAVVGHSGPVPSLPPGWYYDNNNVRRPLPAYSGPPVGEVPLDSEPVGERGVFNDMTISRDTTTSSGFAQDRLMALQPGSSSSISPLQSIAGPSPYPPPAAAGTPVEVAPLPQGFVPPYPTSNPDVADFERNRLAKATESLSPHVDAKRLAPKKLKSRKAVADQEVIDMLRQRIASLEDENRHLQARESGDRSNQKYKVFHYIKDEDETYLEVPTWRLGADDEITLRGHAPVQSKNRYVQGHPEIVFHITKVYDTSELDDETKAKIRLGSDVPEARSSKEYIEFGHNDMWAAASEFFAHFPDLKFPEDREDFVMKSPYLMRYHTRSAQDLGFLSPKHRELMTLLNEWIDTHYSALYEQVDADFSNGLVTRASMPFLFKPAEVVVENKRAAHREQGWMNLEWPRECYDAPTSLPLQQDKSNEAKKALRYTIRTRKYGFDGRFYRVKDTKYVALAPKKDGGSTCIHDLDFYPLRFASSDVRQRLELRGQRCRSFTKKQLISYRDQRDETLAQDERFMIDYNTYRTLHKMDSLFASQQKKYITPCVDDGSPIPAPESYLYPCKVIGYNLRCKKWIDLEVDRMSDVVWNKEAFDHLVVEPETKELVQALITNQIGNDKGTDLIQNKGNGLVMLLHGGPGTGKTFTAESVAEMAEKPLFRVTCGDVGTQPSQVEKYLESVLHLGKIWDCVVLLDEADVFLEQRTLNDLTRNALVSVFLRVLEYYDGILILTSNRVSTFDDAFKSRIQLALHYEALNRIQRSHIWANFFQRLKKLNEANIDFVDVEGYISQLADHEMNGRQIRNAITTARQLAQFQRQDMSYRHLKHVINVASRFDRHLGSLRGSSDDGQDAAGVRDDDTTMSRNNGPIGARLDRIKP